MLVVTRKSGEAIVIVNSKTGERITVDLIRVRGVIARLGIVAPQSYSVHRDEVQRRIDSEKDPDLGKDYA